MSDPCPPSVPLQEQFNPPLLTPVQPGNSILVVEQTSPMIRTALQETDAVGAMRRGLKEYFAQVKKDVAGDRVFFQEVFEEWATSEDEHVRYPSAAVLLADGDVQYDQHSFTPTVLPDDRLPDGRYVIKVSEAEARFLLDVHCSTPGSRIAVAMMMEEAMNPVDWQYGFDLDLPHYFGQRASFALESSNAQDTEATARRGYRPLQYIVHGHISVIRPRALPLFQPRVVSQVADYDLASLGFKPIANGKR